MLEQGIPSPHTPLAGPVHLASSTTAESVHVVDASDRPHIFELPPNTAGTAKVKRRLTFTPGPGPAPPPAQPVLFQAAARHPVPPQGLATIAPRLISTLHITPPHTATNAPHATTSVPYTTQMYRKRKQERERAGIPTRKYVKKTGLMLCKRCQKDRRLPGHQFYFGNLYCEETATESVAEWRESLAAKGYGQKKGAALPAAAAQPLDPILPTAQEEREEQEEQ